MQNTSESLDEMGATTQQDVAEHARVSVSTVWRVLHRPDSVDPATRQTVVDAMDELGYVRKRSRGNSERARQAITLIIPDLANPFFPMVIKGCESVARTHGYGLMIADSENDLDQESEHLALALDRGASGIAIVPSGGATAAIEKASGRQVPMVLLDRTIDGLLASSVVSDNYQGAYQATKYLLRLGHTRILFIAGGTGKSSAQQRLAGFRDAMAASGNAVGDRFVLNAEYDFENAADEVKRALEDEVSFTAVFASADVMAFGAKRALEQHGFAIPADVSLIGYDDILLASSIGLTTVAQPAFEMGREAITTLIDTIEGRVTRVAASVLQPRLVIRDTCRRPR